MKAFAKALWVGAVAMTAATFFVWPSEAGETFNKRRQELQYGSWYGEMCATDCRRGVCDVYWWWGTESKWLPAFSRTCTAGACPPVCKLARGGIPGRAPVAEPKKE
jgi:hypothetical protein